MGVQQNRNDAHGLLRVVAAMTERIERGGDELQIAECTVDCERCEADEDPGNDQDQHERQHEPGEW